MSRAGISKLQECQSTFQRYISNFKPLALNTSNRVTVFKPNCWQTFGLCGNPHPKLFFRGYHARCLCLLDLSSADCFLNLSKIKPKPDLGQIGVLVVTSVAGATNAKDKFRGEISDTQCAMNIHSLSRSHQEMITMKTIGTDSASCARACVRRGGDWVLRSGSDVYRLKNQNGIENFAGHKVTVTGALDAKTNTIDNVHIEDALAPK